MQRWTILLLFGLMGSLALGQESLSQVEEKLLAKAREVLYHDSLEHKIKVNKEFTSLLFQTLKRQESYTYPFDSLKTLSILQAEDDAFRIFTWHIVDRKANVRNGSEFHYYFGLVQRPYVHPDGRKEMIVIPLISDQRVRGGVENELLDNTRWLGAQYYLPKYQDRIEKVAFKPGKVKASSQKDRQKLLSKINEDRISPLDENAKRTDSVYVLGQGMTKAATSNKRSREVYLLFGWNGSDEHINYKLLDALSFDPQDPYRVTFGAAIFYFDPHTPKMRAVFKYAQNAPFSLNKAYVKTAGLFGGKKKIIIYDHMGLPNAIKANPQKLWEMGPDGSYDGLFFVKNRGYRWVKNVEPVEPPTRVQLDEAAANQARIMRLRLQEIRRLAAAEGDNGTVEKVDALLANEAFDRQALRFIKKREKALVKRLEAQREAEAKRLREAGIDLSKKGNSRGNR